MNSSDAYLVIVLVFATWRGISSLEPLPFPVLTFENVQVNGRHDVIQTGAGRFTYLNNINSRGDMIRMKCELYTHDYNVDFEITKDGEILNQGNFQSNQAGDEKIIERLLIPDEEASGLYSCSLILRDRNNVDVDFRFRNVVTERLSVNSNNGNAFCFTNKGNSVLKNEFIKLFCVAPRFGISDYKLTWSTNDGFLCTSYESDLNYVVDLCALTEEWSGNSSCGYVSNVGPQTVWNEQCSLGEVKVVKAQELHIFPERFPDVATELAFSCESNPPLYPLHWYVFTEDGILTFENERHHESSIISIDVISNYVYGNTTLTIQRNHDGRKIDFVVCSTSAAEDGRKLNAISRAVSVEADVASTSDQFPPYISASTPIPSSAPTTAARIVNRTSGKSHHTEHITYPIIVAFLSFLILCLLCYLIKVVFIPKIKSKRAKSVDEPTPPLQDNPAYVSYKEDSSVPVNDSGYTEYIPDGTRPFPYAELQLNPINGGTSTSVAQDVGS